MGLPLHDQPGVVRRCSLSYLSRLKQTVEWGRQKEEKTGERVTKRSNETADD